MAASQTAGGDSLPTADSDKIYLVTGKSLNAICDAIKSNKVKPTTNGGVQITPQGTDGYYIGLLLNKSAGNGSTGTGTGVSQQITGAVNGVPSTIYLFADPSQNMGRWEAV